MAINMSIEYPKLEQGNARLQRINESLIEELKNVVWNFDGKPGLSEVQSKCIKYAKEAIKKAEQ